MKFITRVRSQELSNAIKSIGAWDGKKRLAVENILQKATRDVARGAKQRLHSRTGALKKSIKTGFKRTTLEGVVRARSPYAHIVEFGAKAHMVKARKKKALTIHLSDRLVFSKRASIPAIKARPYIKPAFEEQEPKIVNDIKKVLQ